MPRTEVGAVSGERLAINTVVQGSAADLMKAAMVRVQHRIDADRLPLKMLLQIHDELVLETPEALAEGHAAIVCEEMENAMSLQVPPSDRGRESVIIGWLQSEIILYRKIKIDKQRKL